MIFDKRSYYMLKYEKSKAKLIEFHIAKENYPQFRLNPDDLTYTTIFALSRYCEELIENPSSILLSELKSELAVVSQYYDSTVKTKQRQEHSNLFLLLGSTSYFLSENFGSSKVLIKQISNWIPENNTTTLLYITLYYLLTGTWIDAEITIDDYHHIMISLKKHFEEGAPPNIVFEVLHKLRDRLYKSYNVLDVSYIDFLFAVIICAIDHSAWILLPSHSSSDLEKWKEYISKQDSTKLLWPAQKVIVEAGALIGKDLVVPLPTGVGKTKSIEIILRAKFMCKGSNIAVIIAPLRALCNEITAELTSKFIGEAIINQFTDTTQEDFNLNLTANNKYIFICTPEKFSYILRHEPDFLTAIQLFIFDEAHLFDDPSRGAQYELLVSEIVRSRQESAQLILFSAVLSNSNQISEWLFKDRTATIDYSLVKSTEKSIGFLSSDQSIHYYEKDDMKGESFFVPKSIAFTQLRVLGKERKRRIFPEKNAQDIAIYFANQLCNQGGVAIYAGQVRSIPTIMRRIVEINERGYNLNNLIVNSNQSEIDKLFNLFLLHYGENYELTKVSKLGVFPHYSDLPNGVKMAIEYALRKRHISCVVCTTTLAEGVNIPIKYLFLTTLNIGSSSIQIRKMQNMVGRTARSGIHTEGSTIITDPKFYDKRNDYNGGGIYKWNDCKKMFEYGNTEACTSAILSLVSNLILDYDYYYKASDLIVFLMKNYGKSTCFSSLTDIILKSYKKYISNDQKYKRYASEIMSKIKQLENIIGSIENYLCYIYNSQQSSQHFLSIVDTLVTKTFAYFIGDNEQRNALKAIFQMIAKNIISNVNPEKTVYFARSLYGIDVSNQVLQWVNGNMEYLEEYSVEELLDNTLNLFLQLFPGRVDIDIDILHTISRLWISGETYVNMNHKIKVKLSIIQIEKICSNILSYHLCFLLGNVIDAIGESSEKLVEQLALLQKMIKYGVPTYMQILICENIFDDRIISRQLAGLIKKKISTDKELKSYMRSEKLKILQYLKSYPEYFSYKFRMYIK